MINGKHLTSEQMDRLLADPSERSRCMHLQMCGRCFEELQAMERMFALLRVESSEMASLERGRAVLPRKGMAARGWAFSAVAAALIAVVAVPLAMRHEAAAHAPGAAVAAPAHGGRGVDAAAEAMSDEALLNSIQDDLSASEPAALRPLAVRARENSAISRKN